MKKVESVEYIETTDTTYRVLCLERRDMLLEDIGKHSISNIPLWVLWELPHRWASEVTAVDNCLFSPFAAYFRGTPVVEKGHVLRVIKEGKQM